MSQPRIGYASAMRLWKWILTLLVAVIGLGSLGASCGQSAVAVMPGVINDPANRSLRRALFGFATSELCAEMQNRSIPLKLRDADPVIGRFYPTACAVQELDNGNLFAQILGHGYAWTNVTGRLGFEGNAAIEYDHDFIMDGSRMYVYFRQQQTQSSDLKVLMVEASGQGGIAAVATGVLGTSIQAASQQIGHRVMQHQLARGFTVVRESDGAVRFSLGVVEQGQLPIAPFGLGESDWLVLANERTELHQNQRDFAGPFVITDEDEALYLTALVEGAPAVDVVVVDKAVGDLWIHTSERQAGAPAPPSPAVFEEVIQASVAVAGGRPQLWRRMLRLRTGAYYVVFDNTATAGRTQPMGQPGDDRAALVSYAVQLGDAP